MEVAVMRKMRWMSKKDRIRNDFIRGSVKVGSLIRKVQECRLRGFDHVEIRDNRKTGSKMKEEKRKTKKDKVEENLNQKGHKRGAIDREKWRKRIREGNADLI
ncbi:uncharacterized protein LOC111621729 [Centruroides sculpturatus]|uniref:uncharacterized protein LOC111621729 n=1 Tax=Centruroides sculpturatus TaxID=218467 RepID=UPI000C6DC238|nr:uncharacterized protein LOC111621729 [Centruroides sculpturatus]